MYFRYSCANTQSLNPPQGRIFPHRLSLPTPVQFRPNQRNARAALALRISTRILQYAVGMQMSRKHPAALSLHDSVVFFLIFRRIQELLAVRELVFRDASELFVRLNSLSIVTLYYFVVDILLFQGNQKCPSSRRENETASLSIWCHYRDVQNAKD